MNEINTVILEDGKEYLIFQSVSLNGINYLLLSNVNNLGDFAIRKEIGSELIGLTDEEEFNNVLTMILNKVGEV